MNLNYLTCKMQMFTRPNTCLPAFKTLLHPKSGTNTAMWPPVSPSHSTVTLFMLVHSHALIISEENLYFMRVMHHPWGHHMEKGNVKMFSCLGLVWGKLWELLKSSLGTAVVDWINDPNSLLSIAIYFTFKKWSLVLCFLTVASFAIFFGAQNAPEASVFCWA